MISLASGEYKNLVEDAFSARYVPTGHLVYWQGGALKVMPFDPDELEASGPPVPLIESGINRFHWAVSEEGLLVYGLLPKQSLVWVNRRGEEHPVGAPIRPYRLARVSPDGSRLALSLLELTDLWLYELTRGTMTRLTFHPAPDLMPVWTPDGQKVVFSSSREGADDLFWKSADGTGPVECLMTSPIPKWGMSWSSDAQTFVFEEDNPETGSDIGLLHIKDPRTTQPFIQAPFDQTNPVVSPDGRWIVYESNDSGRIEVYVESFPKPGEKRQISVDGGTEPLWGPDGSDPRFQDLLRRMNLSRQ